MLTPRATLAKARHYLARRLLPLECPEVARLSVPDLLLPFVSVNEVLFPVLGSATIVEDLLLSTAHVTDVAFPVLASAAVTGDLSLRPPKQSQYFQSLDNTRLAECLDFLEVLELRPDVIPFPVLLETPKIQGKSYSPGGLVQTESTESKTPCIHGLQEEWCGMCKAKNADRTLGGSKPFDVFDLLFPVLQPPLEEDFTNPVALPPNKSLYPFQGKGIQFLIEHDRALLADEMGLGKSIQAIIALRVLFRGGKVRNWAHPVLAIF